MSLQVWLPLNGDLHNQGLNNFQIQTVGTPTVDTSGKIGECYVFNGGNGLAIPKVILPSKSPEWSFSCWLNLTNNTSTAAACLFSERTGCNSTGYTIFIYPNNSKILIDDGARWTVTSASFTAGTWYHLAVVRKTTGKYLYINGVLKDSTSTVGTTSAINTNGCLVGLAQGDTTLSGSTSQGWIGKLNDVRIYDHALSAKEVEELAKGLVLHYPLNNHGMGQANNILTGTYYNSYLAGTSVATASNAAGKWTGGSGGNGTFSVVQDDTVPVGNYSWNITNNTSGNRDFQQGNQPYVSGQTYTTSFWAKGNGTCLYRSWNTTDGKAMFSKTWTLTSTWTKYTHTFTASAEMETDSCTFHLGVQGSANISICGMKMELGSTATNYTVAPSEVYMDKIYDCSGYSNNGTIIGDLTAVAPSPRYDVCTHLDCSDPTTNSNTGLSYIQSSLGLTQPIQMSVCWWAKPESGYLTNSTATNAAWCTSINDAPTDYNSTAFHHRDGKFDICLNSASTTSLSLAFNNYTLNEWHHYCVIYDGKVAILYKDGVETNRSTISSTEAPLKTFDKIFIGFSKAGGVWRKTLGSYADFRVYATALTAAQVKELYNTSMSIDSNGNVYARELVS